jgi:hypothetical protein
MVVGCGGSGGHGRGRYCRAEDLTFPLANGGARLALGFWDNFATQVLPGCACAIVTLLFVGAGMLGWRAVARWHRARAVTPSVGTNRSDSSRASDESFL